VGADRHCFCGVREAVRSRGDTARHDTGVVCTPKGWSVSFASWHGIVVVGVEGKGEMGRGSGFS
jgi:hypothetical protein